MRSNLGATIFLTDTWQKGAGEGIKIRRVKDERQHSPVSYYFVLKAGNLTAYIEPNTLDYLIKTLQNARRRKTFDGRNREPSKEEDRG